MTDFRPVAFGWIGFIRVIRVLELSKHARCEVARAHSSGATRNDVIMVADVRAGIVRACEPCAPRRDSSPTPAASRA